ncbi:sulfite exporter TauE/SafE family protein [Alisedimentitalea sp. MJ-SS2]|uniref:sulfite exporter TauE/SafE family protein n=1 Tax=Aliisedimentitalea sp. MJ-SS2 TaxID=3049795 RepID=UPI002908FE95|nr:sulfite exporter TauE/SafE family protein [Alisedimentitalea sp. MJ-SS2]MDU8926408.1 sulfite exporter TauE/SafE family protein [Alisedimentitalea sp. MJ-SS2]
MAEALTQALAIPGIAWVFVAAFVSGIVRGFAGFGTAMIFLPVAAQVLEPIWAVTVLAVMDMIGPLPAIPRALKDGHPRDLLRLAVGAMLALPLGLAVLFAVDPSVFKVAVSLLSLGLLAALISGLRYRGELTKPMVYGTGAMAGFLGGAVAIPGPPVILLYMASPHPAQVVRANNTVFLFSYDILMLIGLAIGGKLLVGSVVLGLITALPYLAGNLTGGWLFRPGLERVYRWVAYAIIATSALSGLWSVIGG